MEDAKKMGCRREARGITEEIRRYRKAADRRDSPRSFKDWTLVSKHAARAVSHLVIVNNSDDLRRVRR